jgi:hypothetical protein
MQPTAEPNPPLSSAAMRGCSESDPGRLHEPEPVAFRKGDEIVAGVAGRTGLKSVGAR